MANRKSLMVGIFVFVLMMFGHHTLAKAQNALQAYVVTNCGTPGITLTQGKYGPVFQNTNGSLCDNGGTSSGLAPLTPMQAALAISSSTALTVPTGATYAVACVEGANARFTTDGTTTPTTSVGMPLLQNQCVSLQGATTIANFRAIQQASTATLDVSYYK